MYESAPSGKSQEAIKKEQEREAFYIKASGEIGLIFDACDNGEGRVQQLIARIGDGINHLENGNAVIENIKACRSIENKKEFTDAVVRATKPLLDLIVEKPDLFIPIAGEDREFIKVNELLSYGKEEGLIHIHVVPDETVKDILVKFKEGLQALAKIVEEDEQVKIITGTSWIVAKHPKIMERFGFTLGGEISPEMRARHFHGEKRPIHEAHMAREDFLKKYLG